MKLRYAQTGSFNINDTIGSTFQGCPLILHPLNDHDVKHIIPSYLFNNMNTCILEVNDIFYILKYGATISLEKLNCEKGRTEIKLSKLLDDVKNINENMSSFPLEERIETLMIKFDTYMDKVVIVHFNQDELKEHFKYIWEFHISIKDSIRKIEEQEIMDLLSLYDIDTSKETITKISTRLLKEKLEYYIKELNEIIIKQEE